MATEPLEVALLVGQALDRIGAGYQLGGSLASSIHTKRGLFG